MAAEDLSQVSARELGKRRRAAVHTIARTMQKRDPASRKAKKAAEAEVEAMDAELGRRRTLRWDPVRQELFYPQGGDDDGDA